MLLLLMMMMIMMCLARLGVHQTIAFIQTDKGKGQNCRSSLLLLRLFVCLFVCLFPSFLSFFFFLFYTTAMMMCLARLGVHQTMAFIGKQTLM